jgi:aminomethyltransferase
VAGADGHELGTLTSTDHGWFLGKALAMGYLPADMTSGSAVVISSPDGATIEAHITHRPFFDPDGSRVRE